jgi:hypothetical protein
MCNISDIAKINHYFINSYQSLLYHILKNRWNENAHNSYQRLIIKMW